MDRNVRIGALVGGLCLLPGWLLAANAAPKDDVTGAATALAGKANYSWKSTVENANGGGGGGRFRAGPTEGKTEKDGFTMLTMTRGNNTIEAAFKGAKGALKTPDGWKTLDDAAQGQGGQGNPTPFIARTLQNFKAPAAEAADLADKTTTIAKADDAYAGDLTEDGAKALLAFGRRGGANAPTPTNVKGSVKFWIADGVLTKYQYNVQGTISFNGNDININRTTTVEIKDVGATKVEVPDEAKQKLA